MNDLVLEKKEKYGELLSVYGQLLPASVLRRMKLYYYDDLSIGEIADNEEVSRAAVYDSLVSGEKSLDSYENKLHLYEKRNELLSLADSLEEKGLKEEADKIREVTDYGI